MAFAGLLNCDRRFSTESGEVRVLSSQQTLQDITLILKIDILIPFSLTYTHKRENEGGETEEIPQLEVVTASVGKKNKQATFFLSDSTQVVDFLDSLSSGYFVF